MKNKVLRTTLKKDKENLYVIVDKGGIIVMQYSSVILEKALEIN